MRCVCASPQRARGWTEPEIRLRIAERQTHLVNNESTSTRSSSVDQSDVWCSQRRAALLFLSLFEHDDEDARLSLLLRLTLLLYFVQLQMKAVHR